MAAASVAAAAIPMGATYVGEGVARERLTRGEDAGGEPESRGHPRAASTAPAASPLSSAAGHLWQALRAMLSAAGSLGQALRGRLSGGSRQKTSAAGATLEGRRLAALGVAEGAPVGKGHASRRPG